MSATASRILPPTPPQPPTRRVAPVPATTAETAGVTAAEIVATVAVAAVAAGIPAVPSKVNPLIIKKTGAVKVPVFFVYLHQKSIKMTMTRFRLSILLSVAVLLCGCGTTNRPSTSGAYPKAKKVTRIVQYNVGVFSKETTNSVPMVAAMMKEIGADAVSLNELDSCNTRHPVDQLADFASAMGGWSHRFSRAMPYREGAYGVGIVVPEEIIESFTIALPKGNGSEPRACCVVETKDYVLASTHLDYIHEPSIVVQAETINKALSERYSRSRKPVFLAGDMNSTPESAVLKELGKEWDVISCRKNTFSANNPHECIDFILVLKNKAKVKVVGSEVPVEFTGGEVAVASDHLPVFVDVKL